MTRENKMNFKKTYFGAFAAVLLGSTGPALAQSGPTTTFLYDASGRLSAVGRPGGRTRTLQWDVLGRNTAQSGSGATVGFGYNGQDKLTFVVDPKGLATTYGRNGFGQATTLTSPDTGVSTHAFDAGGNLLHRTNAAGQVESYTYDLADRVVTKTLTHPVSGSLTYTFGYASSGPSAGRAVSVTAPGIALGYGYNLFGQVTSATQQVNGGPTLAVGYGYATNGTLTSITYPSGRVVTYVLDGVSRVSAITAGGSNLLSGVGYTPLGAVAGWAFGNGQSVTRTFDLNGRLSSLTLPTGPRTYGYDADDRITSITDAVLGNATYGYDDHDRLTSAVTAQGQWGYGYDANGNRTQLTVNGNVYPVIVDGASNRELVSAPFVRQSTFAPDGQPSTVAGGSPQLACGNDVALGYTADGQLVTSNVMSAVYGPDGLRLQKTAAACAGGGTTNFVYDPAGRLLGEYDATGAVIQETVWLGDIPVAVFKSNGQAVVAHYVYADNLNTPRAITNSAGQVVWRWDGEPFGATPADENPSALGQFSYGLRFPGQYFDAETGYHQNRWREYDPKTGRYVQSDPIGLAGGLNTYAYVGGNPLGLSDALGLKPDLNLFDESDPMRAWADATPDLKGWYRVAGHGEPYGVDATVGGAIRRLNARQLADQMRRSGWTPGTPVLLQSCTTGGADDGIAQQLANELGTMVSAPTALVWYYKPDASGKAPHPVPSHLAGGTAYQLRLLLSPRYRPFFPTQKK